MWAIARYDLGLSNREVWWLTIRELAALLERHRKRVRHDDLRYGVVAATIANANRDPKKRPDPFQPTDFFPEPGHRKGDGGGTVEGLKAMMIASGAEVRSRSEGEADGG